LNFDFNAHFLAHPGYYALAKFIVYTKGRTPAESCAEILALASRYAFSRKLVTLPPHLISR
jgi:hypothetical protein